MANYPIETKQIFPSLLAANILELGKEIEQLKQLGIKTLHLDIMDNHYVPNLTFGPHVAAGIKKAYPELILDVHLMTTPVDQAIESFAKAKVNRISIHPEATYHLDRSLSLIRSYECKAGLVLNPSTSLESIEWCLHHLDFVLVMTVNPGFGGQTLLMNVIPKIEQIAKKYPSITIAVDGGIDKNNLAILAKAGASEFIVGSALFHSTHYEKTLNDLCGRSI